MNYIKITFSVVSADVRDILSAQLSQTAMTGIEEADENLTVYYDEDRFPESEIKVLAESLKLDYEQGFVGEKNWNESWEKNFQPVLFDRFCSIRAHFHPQPQEVDYDIIITPKMSFGTGHHATTEMMIRFMQEMDFNRKSVLDFGTGTGVLAILAEKMGATEIIAIDDDEWSVNNALENGTENGCNRVAVQKGSLELVQGRRFDLILANINRHILLQYMAGISDLLEPGGYLLLSGILAEEDTALVMGQAEVSGLTFKSKKIKNNWASALFQK